jgi:hypothetical protein
VPSPVGAEANARAAAVLDHLDTLDPDALTPRDAHAALYALKRLAKS